MMNVGAAPHLLLVSCGRRRISSAIPPVNLRTAAKRLEWRHVCSVATLLASLELSGSLRIGGYQAGRMQKIGLNLLCVCVSAVQVSPVRDCCCHLSCCPVPFTTHGPISSQPVPSFHATLEETATIGLLLHSKNNSQKLQLVDVLCFNWTQLFCLWANFINRHIIRSLFKSSIQNLLTSNRCDKPIISN
jgi:hypothetical protein